MKVLKIIGIIFTILVALVAVFLTYIKVAFPNVGEAPAITVDISPQRIENGKYLAHHVAACMDCHSKRNWDLFAGPLVEGTLGQGGELFDQQFGFPGRFVSKNITPYALAGWTDGEIFRAITMGVNKEGKALFPVMPHANYGQMDQEDIYDIIAYVRSLQPIQLDLPASVPDFPMNFIINTIPKKANLQPKPSKSDTLAYGKYIFIAAACGECHTKQDKGQPIEGMELAGGFEFPMPNGIMVRSANITPDKATGIGNWTAAQFIARFQMYTDSSYTPHQIEMGSFNTIMPWMMYKDMKKEDLAAVFTYLKSVKPIVNKVKKYSKL